MIEEAGGIDQGQVHTGPAGPGDEGSPRARGRGPRPHHVVDSADRSKRMADLKGLSAEAEQEDQQEVLMRKDR